ncbi:MAG: hypothetical protein ACRC4U_11785, partial [Shewanella sp.]
ILQLSLSKNLRLRGAVFNLEPYLIFDQSNTPIALYRAESLELAQSPYPEGFTAKPISLFTTEQLAAHLAIAITCPHCQSHHHALKDHHSNDGQYRVKCQDCGKQYQPTRLFRGLYPDGLNKQQRYYQRNKAHYTAQQRARRQAKKQRTP